MGLRVAFAGSEERQPSGVLELSVVLPIHLSSLYDAHSVFLSPRALALFGSGMHRGLLIWGTERAFPDLIPEAAGPGVA